MHLQEGTIKIFATCSKMTEEVDRRHVVNGKGVHEEHSVNNTASSVGGRLKFFKDGKFILELARAKEGEKVGWVSVPRKTFWPPAAAATPVTSNTSTPIAHSQRNERATSLSVSDDNSSIQSSPWQRDHCWKQSAPRKNISKELTLFYCRPGDLLSSNIDAGSKVKRRKPYDPTSFNKKGIVCNGIDHDSKNGNFDNGEDSTDGLDREREMYHRMKIKKPHQYRKIKMYKKRRCVILKRKLNETVDKLREKVVSIPIPLNNKVSSLSCRQEHTMVSPRKRILRELERVSLEDQANKRRARNAPSLSTASYPAQLSVLPVSSNSAMSPTHHPASPVSAPGPSQRSQVVRPTPIKSKNVSSYSINSLLSIKDEPSRSPDNKWSPIPVKVESPVSSHSPAPSESPDGLRYRYTPYVPYARGYYPPQRPREDYVYGYPGAYVGALWRPAATWLQYVGPTPPGPWACHPHMPHPLIHDHIPKEEPSSDLPLNLSKH